MISGRSMPTGNDYRAQEIRTKAGNDNKKIVPEIQVFESRAIAHAVRHGWMET